MFSHFSSIKNGFYVKILASLFIALFITACPEAPIEPGALEGKWVNESYGYTTIINITGSNVVYEGSYEADIANSTDFNGSYGVIIVKFTKYADWGEEPTTTHTSVGKYGALYWKDLTESSVSMADAYEGYTHVVFNTLQEAESTFTIDAVGSYINWSITSPYAKQ